ncbi:ubiquitin-like small modifier protein 1 [Halomarina halobia]|uniref:Ubiquitin-like small modifier protein 1 n=1 Tax=Halomarina halobia TaxID=3033386 RepID=A0ABD6A566_9EURY|nr:ubiquitin-like small modifier protein 1 [Halomarina sp. PSR21]
MSVQFELYGTLRDAVGERRLAREVPAAATVEVALREVTDEYPPLGSLVFDGDGRLRPHLNVLVNGENVRDLAGGKTRLSAGDTVGAVPSVAGGRA